VTGEWKVPARVSGTNWARALETYRTAVAAYRRVLEFQSERRLRHDTRLGTPAPANHEVSPFALAGGELERLTQREREVADLVARGYTNQEIAEVLVLTHGTVANHVAHMLAKLGASNRTQIAARVLEAAITAGAHTNGVHPAPAEPLSPDSASGRHSRR
jgi:DNA-binding NarL/FixJ family response regulator